MPGPSHFLEATLQDARYGLRGLGRDPGFAVVAALILALGIGANSAVFSVVNAVLLRPLPFRDAGRLVWIAQTGDADGLSGVTYPVGVFEEYRRHARSFEDLTAYFAFFGYESYKLTGRGEPEQFSGVRVVPNFFDLLGAKPFLGRSFEPDEYKLNGRRAALIGYGLWKRRFSSDPRIVGQTVELNNQAVTIIGVLGPQFDFSSVFAPGTKVDLFTPVVFDEMRTWGNTLAVIGRLKPGATVETARAEFQVMVAALDKEHPEWRSGHTARLTPLKEQVSGRMRRALFVLWGAVGVVLLIVCANLSNLMLARAAGRTKEMAVRVALGAGRGRLVRQLVTEGILLSFAGAALGVPLAYALTRALKTSPVMSIPLLHRVAVDATALAFTAALAIAAGVVFGALPGLRVSSANLHDVLKETTRGATEGRQHAWLRSSLVVGEVALACMLLIGAGLLLRSFMHLLDVDLGFQPSRAASIRIDSGGSARNPAQSNAFLAEVKRRVETVPGIEVAGLTDALPLDRNRFWGIAPLGRTYPRDETPGGFVYVVGPGFLRAMGIPLRSGREFAERDSAQTEPSVIVNETMARRFWPGEDPIGKQVRTNGRPGIYRVVGVAADVRQEKVEGDSGLQFYLHYAQADQAGAPELVVRTRLSPAAMASAVRGALRSLDPNAVTTDYRPLDNLVDRAVSPRRFLLLLLAGFALLALVLASLGIYGVISYSVNQRLGEIGIRMALGATPGDVRGEVLRGTFRLAATGIAIGLAGSWIAGRFLASLLFGTSARDPLTFAAIAAVLGAVAVLAGYLPALRASRIRPMSALRTS